MFNQPAAKTQNKYHWHCHWYSVLCALCSELLWALGAPSSELREIWVLCALCTGTDHRSGTFHCRHIGVSKGKLHI
jgi:hypothetical protein